VLICCKRKVLLVGWWLVIDAYLVREKNVAGWLADKPAEQSKSCNEFLPQYAILKIVSLFSLLFEKGRFEF